MTNNKYAYITSVSNNTEVIPAIILAKSKSLIDYKYDMLVFINSTTLTIESCEILTLYFDKIININNDDIINECYKLKQYKKIIYLDNKYVIINPINNLFKIKINNTTNNDDNLLLIYPNKKIKFYLQNKKIKNLIYITDIIPYHISRNQDIKTLQKNKKCRLWHNIYNLIKQEYKISKFSNLKEVSEINALFKSKHNLGRQISPNHINTISKIYNSNNINSAHLEYYQDINKTFYSNNIVSMFKNIEAYDYFKPYILLSKYYNRENYYEIFIKKNNDIMASTKLRLDLYDKYDTIDRDDIMLEYIKCRMDVKIITIYPIIHKYIDINTIINIFSNYGYVYYVKTFYLPDVELYRYYLINLFKHYNNNSLNYFIEQKILTTYGTNLTMIVFDNINNYNINDIRFNILNIINANIDINNIFHTTDNFHHTIDIASLYLNNNNKIIFENNKIINLQIQTFKKWLYSNLSLLEISRLLLFEDNKGIMISIDDIESHNEIELAQFISTNCHNKKTKLYFLDIISENNKNLFKIINNKEIPSIYVSNPRLYYYKNGLKYIN